MFEVRDTGRDGVGGDGTVAGGNEESIRVRVFGGSPRGSEYGSGLNVPLLKHAFLVRIFVPVRGVTAHCTSTLLPQSSLPHLTTYVFYFHMLSSIISLSHREHVSVRLINADFTVKGLKAVFD